MMRFRNLIAVSLLLSVFAITARAQDISADSKKAILDGVSDIVTKQAFVPGVDFSKWPDMLAKHKDDIDKATDVPSFAREVNRALRELNITHIRLQTPRAATDRRSTVSVGLGVFTRKEDAGLSVTGVAPESPAAEAGLEPGDLIEQINSTPATDPSALQGEEGKSVTLKVKKKSGEEKDVKLEFKKFTRVRPATLTWQDDKKETAVLRIPTFSTGYDRDNVEKLMKEAAPAKYLILDLRSNGGGATTSLNHLLSLLLPDATPYGSFVRKRTVDRFVEETKGKPDDLAKIAEWDPQKTKTRKNANVDPFKGKIAVLINRGSASASEICTAALRDGCGAVVVGTRSAGAVLASVYGRLPDGFELQYPISDYVTIKGIRLEGHPTEPDVAGPAQEKDKPDAWVAAAVDKLKSAATAKTDKLISEIFRIAA